MTDAPHPRRRRVPTTLLAVVLAAALAAGTTVALTAADGHAQMADTSGAGQPTSPSSLPTPPATFPGQVTGLYDEIYQVDELLQQHTNGSTPTLSNLPSQTTFDQDMAGLTQQELDELYQATEKNPQWSTLPTRVQNLLAEVQQAPFVPAVRTRTRTSGSGSSAATSSQADAIGAASPPQAAVAPVMVANLVGGSATGTGTQRSDVQRSDVAGGSVSGGSFPPPVPTGSFPPAPAPYQPSAPLTAVAPYTPTSCPSGAPGGPPDAPGDAAIFAAQLTTDVATNVAQDVPSTLLVVIAGEGTSIPDPAKYIAEAIALAGVITLDTLNYVQQVAADCDTANRDGFLATIDNTTVNVYDLLTLVQQTVDDTENSVDTIAQQVGVLQQTADEQLVLGIEQALTAPLGSVPNVAYELPASLGGYLDSTPIGVQQVVTTDVHQALAAGLPVNAAATQFLTMADAALAAGNDTLAYADFQNAYQQAAQ